MQDLKWVVEDILKCGSMEVDMLLETEIDIANTVQIITENGDSLDIETLYSVAFYEKVLDVFIEVPEYYEDDFEIYYNGALDTRIYIKNDKYDFYHEKYPELIDEIETYMNMEFQEGV